MNRPTFPIALARALAALPDAWAPGMMRLRSRPAGARSLGGGPAEEAGDWLRVEGRTDHRSALDEAREDGAEGRCVMDLDDPATVGALLGVYRTLTGDPRAYVMFSGMAAAWVCCARGRDPVEDYTSDGRAIALAILAVKGVAVFAN